MEAESGQSKKGVASVTSEAMDADDTRAAPGGLPTFRVAVQQRAPESAGLSSVAAAQQMGIGGLTGCEPVRLFFLRGALARADVARLTTELLADPVAETATIAAYPAAYQAPTTDHAIEVAPLPGVTDPVAENLLRAAHLLGIRGLQQAATGHAYWLTGPLRTEELQRLAWELFANPVVQRAAIDSPVEPPFLPTALVDLTVELIPLRTADDATLQAISSTRRLSLDLAEMQAIRAYFAQQQRDPTDVELEMLAQTWSEHCVHKTFKALITCTGAAPDPERGAAAAPINGLLRTYIRGATEQIARPWVRSAFVDNAGIVAFDERWDLAFKVETHNHPSALEPFGGANTGVGGVVRDVLGVSARPIANTDVLCFGPADLPPEHLPTGVLHPRRIADGVIRGIEDYGNKMGIPTVNGAIFYHPGYIANPLVFCGCLGLLPRDSHPTTPRPDDLIVVLGGRTGRDGLRGATFSSMEMDAATSSVAGSAVQIGHPIHEKQLLEVVLRARDEQLYHAITDCGAGGLSSAVGEMAQHLGATVHLEQVPLKYSGLRPWEVWLSEAQERMVLAVPPAAWPRLQEICTGQEIEAVAIGSFARTGRLMLMYGEMVMGDVALDFLHEGLPQRQMIADLARAAPTPPAAGAPAPGPLNLEDALLALLAHPNIGSKEDVVRRYDHEVQGSTAVKPLVGTAGQGPGDATVLVPLDTVQPERHAPQQGVALAVGLCPQFGEQDPYTMAWAAIDEALRNVVAVGADPDRVALLDNFCWGNPTLPDRLGSLLRCAQGCYDAAVAYGAPFVSGKDSLNNEYMGADGRRHAIPGTLLISALGIVPDVQRTATMDLKQPDNLLYLVGDTRAELGGSHYALVQGSSPAGHLPQPVEHARERLRAIHQALGAGLVQACHDCSEGGLGVALAEMCLAGHLGAEIDLTAVPVAPGTMSNGLPDYILLFAESLCRFVVEVCPEDAAAFAEVCAGLPCAPIGRVSAEPTLHIEKRSVPLGRVSAESPVHSAKHPGSAVLRLEVARLEAAFVGDIAHAPVPASPAPAPRPVAPAPVLATAPRVLVLHASGTNRDREAAYACELAGGLPEIVHVNQLLAGERHLLDFAMLVVPGGFSYGDDLGAGTLWALDLRHRLGADVARFVASGRPVLGICNGFQALVKAGLLPGDATERTVTLAPNAVGRFECRWVYLQPDPSSPCLFTQGLDEPVYCPVAHGEGRLQTSTADLDVLQAKRLVALTYVNPPGTTAAAAPAAYPANPNGSAAGIAGICNAAGNVLGLMPHPEDHIFPWQHPRWHRGEAGMSGLRLFANGLRATR